MNGLLCKSRIKMIPTLLFFKIRNAFLLSLRYGRNRSQQAFTCSNSKIETVEKGVKYVQS